MKYNYINILIYKYPLGSILGLSISPLDRIILKYKFVFSGISEGNTN